MWSFSHTPMLFYAGGSLTCPCYFMWRVSLTHPMLCYVGSFSYMPLCYVGSSSYMPPCYFTWGVSLICPMLFYVGVLINSLVCWSYLCWICAVCRCRRRECLSSGWRSARWSGRTIDLDSKTHVIHANHFSTLLYSLSFITKGCFWELFYATVNRRANQFSTLLYSLSFTTKAYFWEFTYCKQDSKPIQYIFIWFQFYYKGLLLRVYIL